jgi:hypothetical protein
MDHTLTRLIRTLALLIEDELVWIHDLRLDGDAPLETALREWRDAGMPWQDIQELHRKAAVAEHVVARLMECGHLVDSPEALDQVLDQLLGARHHTASP